MHFEHMSRILQIIHWAIKAVGIVVGGSILVAVNGHKAVSLIVPGLGGVGTVDGDLVVVGSQSVAVSVCIGEQATLQHLIRRRLDTRHHVGGTESDLLHLSKVVLGVPVKHNLAHRDQGVLSLGPDLGEIKWVPTELLSLLKGHHLDGECIGGLQGGGRRRGRGASIRMIVRRMNEC